jgi:uncharacterized protein (TIRG00374 family)
VKGGGRWRVALGFILSAAAIAYVLFRTGVADVWRAILSANFLLLALAAVVATAIFPLRALRWRYILEAVDPDIPYAVLWRSTAIGFALNNSLPARIGEVARAYVLSRQAPKVGFAAAFASLAVDRLFDAIVLLGMLVIGLMGLPAAANVEERGVLYASLVTIVIGVAALLVGLVAIAFFPSRVIRLYQYFARRIAPPLEARGSALLASFASGLSALTHPVRFSKVLFWTVVHWLVNATAFWIGFHALSLEVPNAFLAAMATQSIVGFAIAVPSAPGGLGLFQASATLALYGVSETPALAWAFGFWAFSFIPITAIGMSYFAQQHLSLGEIRSVVRDFRGGGDSNRGKTIG